MILTCIEKLLSTWSGDNIDISGRYKERISSINGYHLVTLDLFKGYITYSGGM